MLWREEDGRMVGQKICPPAGPMGVVLCLGSTVLPRNHAGRPTGSARSSRDARTGRDAGMTGTFNREVRGSSPSPFLGIRHLVSHLG